MELFHTIIHSYIECSELRVAYQGQVAEGLVEPATQPAHNDYFTMTTVTGVLQSQFQVGCILIVRILPDFDAFRIQILPVVLR